MIPTLPILLLSLGAVLAGLVLWQVPKWQVRRVEDVQARLGLETEARKTLVLILGGAALIAVLYLNVQTHRLALESYTTDRLTRAIDQLGEKELELRLGGIYALERIAHESDSHHWGVMEVLTAYVRERAPGKDGRLAKETQPAPKLAPDIQAVLTVLGRRARSYKKGEDQRLDLRDVNLRRANLRSGNLKGAILSDAHLEEAALSDARLDGAVLREAHLKGADLSGAVLKEAFLSKAHLEGANLSKAQVEGAIFSGAHLEGANLTGVTGLTREQIEAAITDEKTRFPAFLHTPAQATP